MPLTAEEKKLVDDFTDQFESVYELWKKLVPVLKRENYESEWIPQLDKWMGDVYEERQYINTALIGED